MKVPIFFLGIPLGCTGSAPPDHPSPTVTHGEALDACGLTSMASTLPYEEGLGVATISLECAELLGTALGMDWQAFGTAPSAIDVPENTAELIISGYWVLLASDLGGLTDACALLPSGSELCREMKIHGSERVNSSLFELVGAHTISTSTSGWNEANYAVFSAGHVKWSDPLCENFRRDRAGQVPSSIVASILAHEATHDFLPHHVSDGCPEGSPLCDLDGRGAFGANAMTMSLRFERLETLGGNDCSLEELHLMDVCEYKIADASHISACDTLAIWDC